MPARPYTRKIAAEEAREGYFLVEKSRLSYFPAAGEPFVIHEGGTPHQVHLIAEHCECRGPDKPHEHYSVPFSGIAPGTRVTLTRTAEGEYALERS